MDQAQATGLQTSLDTSVRATGTTPNSGYKTVNNDSLIDDMVAAFGRIWLDDTGKCTYNGASSAVSFLESFRRRFGDEHIPAMRAQLPIAEYALPKLFSTAQFLPDWKDELIVLPPQDIALKLSRAVFDEACILTHFIHQPTFLERLKLIYSKTLHQYCEEDRKFLPLFYAMLALGSLFEPGQLIGTGFQAAIHKGIEYLVTSRRLIDPECRDLLSLQAMTLITMFLMCTVRTSTSYSYVGTLVRLAFQLGLHRSFPSPSDIILRESRIRTFWVIRSMDVYVGLMVGLPKAINDEDIDQSMPTDVCDEYIRPDTILCMPEGKVSRVSGLIAYTGLLPIMGKIVRNVYPTRFEGTNNESGGYLVSDAKIHDIERDLEAWRESLKPELRIDYPASSKTVERIQYTLWMSFCYLQLMLYHPFVQSLSNPDSGIPKDARSRGYAAKCESVSLNVIKIGKHMLRRGTLGGAPWFPVNIICFAIQTLVLPATNSRDSTASKKILKEMETGRATIASLKTRYESADRCSRILDVRVNSFALGYQNLTFVCRFCSVDFETVQKIPSTDPNMRKGALQRNCRMVMNTQQPRLLKHSNKN
ncbi:fungal-specific transcription factor domain-containing protein [Xylogone sp. PMI_703]|nr:fungal-specific transcription factor domain-containing protein [Xylogone sp. PMI_703]